MSSSGFDSARMESIRAVIRREAAWESLIPIGVELRGRNPYVWSFNSSGPVHSVGLNDLVIGLLRGRESPDLEEWAAFMLAASPLLNFDELPESSTDLLLSTLWALSAGDPVSDESWRSLERLV